MRVESESVVVRDGREFRLLKLRQSGRGSRPPRRSTLPYLWRRLDEDAACRWCGRYLPAGERALVRPAIRGGVFISCEGCGRERGYAVLRDGVRLPRAKKSASRSDLLELRRRFE